MLADIGFTHIRLPVEPKVFMDTGTGALKTEFLPSLDAAIARIRKQGLAVIVDAHPKTNAYKKMARKYSMPARYLKWWGAFAKHLSQTDPEWVFLEPLNEPGGQSYWAHQAWWDYQDKLFTVIRANAPHSIKALRDCVKQGLGKRRRLAENFAKVTEWAEQHKRRIYVGEFGVMYKYAPHADRCRWLTAVRETMETADCGWAMWEYGLNFGITEGRNEPGKRTLNTDVVKALGLTVPAELPMPTVPATAEAKAE